MPHNSVRSVTEYHMPRLTRSSEAPYKLVADVSCFLHLVSHVLQHHRNNHCISGTCTHSYTLCQI